MKRTPMQVAAQVAVESAINMPGAYDAETLAAIHAAGIEAGVSDFYLEMLEQQA